MARFFIDRPIFAAVIAILITLAGGLAAPNLPISQFPPVTPPTIQVDCNYPGASADVVAKTIAAPIEQRVNGVERMLYMSSQSTSDGSYTLTVTFETGTNLNLAQVLVQNRVNLAVPELPEQVRAIGVIARKRSPEILLTVSINSPDNTFDQLYLSNYAALHLREDLVRIRGISEVLIFGQRDYSMRVWVDPDRLEAKDLTVLDVMTAIRGQNAEVAAGQVGGAGDAAGGPTQLTVTTQGRLQTPEEFGGIVVKHGAAGELVRVRDVAAVELGARSNDIANAFDRKPTVGLAIFLQPDANALWAKEEIDRSVKGLKKEFPKGMEAEIGYDTAPYIKSSIDEVYKALRDSIVLVAIVVLVFLQSWRAALIPLAAVPVAIVGTFAAMSAVGFGVNNLTLFGLVLSVGIVVDDSIVVVEAVQHHIDGGLPPRAATLAAMREVSGPVVAVGLVLSAVFVPCAFFPGIVGLFFRQFAFTVAVSTLISTFNSLSLSPALAALLLKGKGERRTAGRAATAVGRIVSAAVAVALLPFTLFARAFNRAFDLLGRGYVRAVGGLVRVPLLLVALYAGLVGFGAWGYVRLPSGFIPSQDKGYLIASVQLPDAASAEQTREVMDRVQAIALDTPGVRHVNAVAGNSFALSAYGSNFGSMFIILDDFDARRGPGRYADEIAAELRKRTAAGVPKATVAIFGAPAVPGLGRSGGVRLMVEDLGEVGMQTLQGQTQNLVEQVNQQPQALQGAFTVFRTSSPQLKVVVDDAACKAEGVDPLDVYATMQASLGQRYVNDFNRFGRVFQVNVQAKASARGRESDVRRLKVRNAAGELVPLGALARVTAAAGPLVITRYNTHPAAAVQANVALGASTGDAIEVFEQLARRELPASSMGFEWTELTYIERRSRDTGVGVFACGVAVVFLVLAALYESWALPLAVILVVPTCVLSALAGVWLAGQDVNLFTQVGFVVLIGLACKNAILIVEYAKKQREAGADRRAAVLAACRLRLRPILMTSLAFILGVMPLAFSTGAGAEMRRSLGVTVFAGMIGVTAFGVFLTPVFFVLVDRLTEGRWAQSSRVRGTLAVLKFTLAFGWLRALVRATAAKPTRADAAPRPAERLGAS